MAVISINEILSLVVLVFALGYIFSGFVQRPKSILEKLFRGTTWNDILYAGIVVSPAVVVHELAHKGVGLYFGFDSVLSISAWGLAIGVLLRFFRSPIIFFVPAFVSSSAAVAFPEQFAILALAGPAANFVLYWISEGLLLSRKWPKYNQAFMVSKQINLWLLILNMIPIGIFDGAKVLAGAPTVYFGSIVLGGVLIYWNERKWKRYVRGLA